MNGPIMSFIGNITRDPGELKYSRNGGVAYLTIGVAVNTWPGQDQPMLTDYFNATLFGRHAENALNRCHKGDQVFVQGNYRMRRYNRQDGTEGISQDVNVREFHHFTRGTRSPQEDGQNALPASPAETGTEAAPPANQAPAPGASGQTPASEGRLRGNEEDPIGFGEPFNMEEVEAGDPFGDEAPTA